MPTHAVEQQVTELADGRVVTLEQQVAELRARLARLEGAAVSAAEPTPVPQQLTRHAARFKPLEPETCRNVKPCLRSTARERLKANCTAAMWSGSWRIDPQKPSDARGLSQPKGWKHQHFTTAAADCEEADPFVLAPTHDRHVTVATSQFTTSRLAGLRGALWLMMGTSIDHGIVHEVCVRFGREVLVADAAPTLTHPRPGLHFTWCRLPSPLNLTMVEMSARGLATLAHQRDAARWQQAAAEVQALLGTIGWSAGPTFLSLAGVEWDLKNMATQKALPSSAAEWDDIRSSLRMQAAAARRVWPRLKAIALRTQFKTTYKFSAGWVHQDVKLYEMYSDLMRGLARESFAQRFVRSPAASRPGGRWCGMVSILDMDGFMNCSWDGERYQDGCSYLGQAKRDASWTRDGLHPMPWVYHQYWRVAANALADVGEACEL